VYSPPSFGVPEGNIRVSFALASDMRNFGGDSPDYFRGVCEHLAAGGPGDFMISAGDLDPDLGVYSLITEHIGPAYTWYPVVGNHDAETPEDMVWLRNYNSGGTALPNIVNSGPAGSGETMYSFDYENAHFVVLNVYYDGVSDTGTDGDITDATHSWLVSDLTANTLPVVFVIGHEPAFPQPDVESGRVRHVGDSLDQYPANRDRFWDTLGDYGVTGYICGHNHNHSIVEIDGVWQIDDGHAIGIHDMISRSTFLMVYVMDDDTVWIYTYRQLFHFRIYELTAKTHLP
jgi:hypothetical protein